MGGIYTRGGDTGETSLLNGERVSKWDDRVETYGIFDEAGCSIGMARVSGAVDGELLLWIQKKMFPLCAELSGGDVSKLNEPITADDIKRMELEIDRIDAMLHRKFSFQIPVKNQISGFLHQARTIVRRGERQLCKLAQTTKIRTEIKTYVNRLSDLLYMLACEEELIQDISDIVIKELTNWRGGESMTSSGSSIYQLADKLIADCEKKANDIKVPMVISVVDESGVLCALKRMPSSLLISVEVSQNKAYTAAALKSSTDKLYDLVQPGGELYGIGNCNEGKIITFGGGYPIFEGGELIGALGVSGGTVEEDMTVASYALEQSKL
ncbi:MAG: cob(I)yrinic acid a,c-diamide adenosyltransferase [Oscillospiraceae bacterium]